MAGLENMTGHQWSLSSYYHHYRTMDHFGIKEVIVGNLFARQSKTVFNESIDFEICCIAYKTCKIRMIMLEGTSFPNVQFVLLRRPHSPPAWSARVIRMVPLSFQSGGVTQVANQIHCWKTSISKNIFGWAGYFLSAFEVSPGKNGAVSVIKTPCLTEIDKSF